MRKYRYIIIFFALIAIAAILSQFGLLGPIKDYSRVVLSPLTATFERIGNGAATITKTLTSINSISKENEKLRNRNLELESQNIRLKEVEHENNLLKEELQFMKTSPNRLISAKIIAKSPTGFADTAIINKGSKDGIKTNQAVVSHGYLVGQIRSVYSHSATILFITSNSSKIPVMLQDSRGTGLLQGGLRGLRIEDIPLDSQIKTGEAVVTSDLGRIIPYGIPVGKILEIISPESEIAQSAALSSPIAFTKLEMVFILK